MDLITAVITTYKREPSIVERALKSVLNQTYQAIEIIIVDDSPDSYEFRKDVERTVQKYAKQNVRYIAHSANLGACAARNTGLSVATGTYIAFLDDDDEWETEKIQKQYDKFCQLDEQVALVYCGRSTINDITGQKSERNAEYFEGYVFDKLIMHNFVGSTSYPLLRTDSLKKIGGFDVEMLACQDFDVWLRLAEKYKISFVEEPLVNYHLHKGECITANLTKKLSGLQRINEKNISYLERNPRAYYKRLMSMTSIYASNKQLNKAISTWVNAAKRLPFKVKDNFSHLYHLFVACILAHRRRK